MAVNKVSFGGNTLIDLTGDTLESAEQLLKGIIAHSKDGNVITGLMEAGGGGGGEYEISTGIIMLSEDAESLSFEHGLSKAPNFVHIFLPIGQPVTSYANALRTMYYKSSFNSSFSPDDKYDIYTSRSSKSYYYHENANQPGDVFFSIDDTTVTAPACGFNTSTKRKWLSGKPYHWICIAGEVVFPYK